MTRNKAQKEAINFMRRLATDQNPKRWSAYTWVQVNALTGLIYDTASEERKLVIRLFTRLEKLV